MFDFLPEGNGSHHRVMGVAFPWKREPHGCGKTANAHHRISQSGNYRSIVFGTEVLSTAAEALVFHARSPRSKPNGFNTIRSHLGENPTPLGGPGISRLTGSNIVYDLSSVPSFTRDVIHGVSTYVLNNCEQLDQRFPSTPTPLFSAICPKARSVSVTGSSQTLSRQT